MMTRAPESPAPLSCHRCGYDLRAHPPDGKCPECAAPVAESRRRATLPRRPPWHDSDPRWRRRILAGAWLLALLPLRDTLWNWGWISPIPAPALLDYRSPDHALVDTLFCTLGVYEAIVCSMGLALLFSAERGRRLAPLDWTRPVGLGCAYILFLLAALQHLDIIASVIRAIGTMFLTIPHPHRPEETAWFVNASTAYLYYAPRATLLLQALLIAVASVAVLLACVPLHDALRSSRPGRLTRGLIALLALLALIRLARATLYCVGFTGVLSLNRFVYEDFFQTWPLTNFFAGPAGWPEASRSIPDLLTALAAWSILTTIALLLTHAQLSARPTKTGTGTVSAPPQ